MKHISILSSLLLAACASGGSEAEKVPEEHPAFFLFFDGRDQAAIEAQRKGGSTAVVGSAGGELAEAVKVTELLLEKFETLRVSKVCLSACAEVLARMASSQGALEIEDDAMIGFHHNPLIFLYSSDPDKRVFAEKCLSPDIEQMQEVIELTKGVSGISKIQMENLGYYEGSTLFNEACDNEYYLPPIKYWFPNSDQLRNLFGFEFKGSVCADDIECIKAGWSNYSAIGDSLLIGDTIITAEGSIDGKIQWVKD